MQLTKIRSLVSYLLWCHTFANCKTTCLRTVTPVPQGLILGPLLFNIFLCDLFLEHEGYFFSNYADDATLHANNTREVVENLNNITQKLFTWFANNRMKANPSKIPLIA